MSFNLHCSSFNRLSYCTSEFILLGHIPQYQRYQTTNETVANFFGKYYGIV